MWFIRTNRGAHRLPLFLEKMEESADIDQPRSKTSFSTVRRVLGIAIISSIVILILIFSAGVAVGMAHSLDLSTSASKIFLANAAKDELMVAGDTEVRRHIVTRVLGWTWWNGAQFGAWVALSASLFGFGSQIAGTPAGWALAAGGTVCYLLAIAGGAGVNQKTRSINGHEFLNVKSDNGGLVAIGLQPVDLSSDLYGWALPANLSWHKVMHNQTDNTFLASDGVGFHGLVSLAQTGISERNGGNNFDSFDAESDYIYAYLEDGNSAREYYYDHSVSDWQNYMPGLAYWVVDGDGTSTFQQFCMVPQDSQGNAVAAVSVQTNFNSYADSLVCAQEAEDANGTFDPN